MPRQACPVTRHQFPTRELRIFFETFLENLDQRHLAYDLVQTFTRNQPAINMWGCHIRGTINIARHKEIIWGDLEEQHTNVLDIFPSVVFGNPHYMTEYTMVFRGILHFTVIDGNPLGETRYFTGFLHLKKEGSRKKSHGRVWKIKYFEMM